MTSEAPGSGRIGVDVGGTFTDIVFLSEGVIRTSKVPSTPGDQSEGVMQSVEAAGIVAGEAGAFAHGTTVATNALLERNGARTALITTDGFRDVIEIGRQNRPSLYDLTLNRPPSLVPRELRMTVRERMNPSGEAEPLDVEGLGRIVDALGSEGVESVAVCFLFGFLHPEHELVAGRLLREAMPEIPVCLSSEVLPEIREFERAATTVATAYLGPRLSDYLKDLAGKAEDAGLPQPLVMQSSGGVIDIAGAAENAAACVLSGPAAGVIGATHVAGLSGYQDLLTLDMGGTSTDVAPVVGGVVGTTNEGLIGGVPIRFPMVDVVSVSAGGGSIAWVDPGGNLRIGPRSAGADPGPAAYGSGGTEPTVTDANLALGYLADGASLGGEITLNGDLAERAIEPIAARLGVGVIEAARGIVEVANAEMTRALRLVSVERGIDPRELVLVAFGGAGPMHACALADELRATKVLVPRSCGVLSALGLAIGDLRRDYVTPFISETRELDPTVLDSAFETMRTRARQELVSPILSQSADLRYQGQSFELTVDADCAVPELLERFHATHRVRYGYRVDDQPVQLVNLRLTATVTGSRPELPEESAPAKPEVSSRSAWFDGELREIPVLDRAQMGAGTRIDGPAVIDFPEATCVVRAGWGAETAEAGNLILERK